MKVRGEVKSDMAWAWLFVVCCAAAFVVSVKRKSALGMALAGVFGALGLLTAVTITLGSQLSSQEAAQRWATHQKHLAWQRSHPKQYVAQRARARAAEAHLAANERAARAREHAKQERQEAAQRESDRIANLPENRDPCAYANGRVEQGWTDFKASDYQSAYDNAVKGLATNDRCDDDDFHRLNEGFLLSVKGMSEHYLSSGDSRTDLNQAETVLEECQTNPKFYGTHTGAECQTQQENDISATTNWDVDGN